MTSARLLLLHLLPLVATCAAPEFTAELVFSEAPSGISPPVELVQHDVRSTIWLHETTGLDRGLVVLRVGSVSCAEDIQSPILWVCADAGWAATVEIR